jgi:hypothetical protein
MPLASSDGGVGRSDPGIYRSGYWRNRGLDRREVGTMQVARDEEVYIAR